MSNSKIVKICALLIVSLVLAPLTLLAADCEELPWRRGKPYDYYDVETREPSGTFSLGLLYMVESAHFTRNVRTLKKGHTGAQPGDLMFVLSSIPNHPEALDAYSKYTHFYNTRESFRIKKLNSKPKFSPECFIKRAIALYPKYASTHLVLGMHYYRNTQFNKAIAALQQSLSIDNENAETHYILGLAFLKIGNIDSAKLHAEKAYARGYPLPGLKNELAKFEKQ
ncbi:tetratricopeptide repeat protein [Thalassotalea euphylliae]|uniref:Tetratricopeptide repeat protein n=1 Tax=Thalassotalea euphylliae TaxID=1655234 RepID=A0A3E0U3H2_9GAMM|nr:tetratricopeptide repeat protein [Thalassotalea euphylliae]REL31137.1 tetratricopeptide repeat protein [Thalassotalea euphylliae]